MVEKIKIEKPKKHHRWGLIVLITLLVIVIVMVIVYAALAVGSYNAQTKPVYGVTFSKKFAEYLRLDWKAAYLATLDDLQVKYLRIPTYWDNIEPENDQYDFSAIDWQINEAAKREAKIILVVGRRQPRWPECHDPEWVGNLEKSEARTQILENIKTIVNRYKDNQAIEMWQVENEPFLDFFGECPKLSKKQLQEEIDLVKSLDNRKVLITDSGELSIWYPLGKMGDYFGTTLYRTTHNKYIGYWDYFFIPPSFYRVKAILIGSALKRTFVAELQAEPWFPDGPLNVKIAEHYKTMNAKKLVENADFARKTNFSRAYFWGVEWWYWLKNQMGDDSVWQAAKQYFK